MDEDEIEDGDDVDCSCGEDVCVCLYPDNE